MGSAEVSSASQIHVFALPFPVKSHINPLLHLCDRLAAKGFRITLITTAAAFKSMQTETTTAVKIETFEYGSSGNCKDDGFRIWRAASSQGLREVLEKYRDSIDLPRSVVIYSSTMPWILDVVHSVGVKGASFFTQSVAVCSVYYHMGQGTIKFPFEKETTVRVPSMPALEFDDLPHLHSSRDPSGLARLLTDQFRDIENVDFILFNTFDKLEDELASWMAKRWPIITVGPAASLTFVNKKLKNTTNNIINHEGNSLFETNTEACLKWLDQCETNTVIYVSFGSIISLEKDQMEEVAEALLRIKCKFLWVVRNGEESKLPASFKNDSSEQGLVINWCPQLQVLAHRAVACFVTHCGWNSTIEGLSSGVPMIAVPKFWDQPTNAKFIADVWQVGIRAKVDEKGIATRDELERCIREVTEGEKGEELNRNALKWKELAIEAVSEGGSSERNMEEFVSTLLTINA